MYSTLTHLHLHFVSEYIQTQTISVLYIVHFIDVPIRRSQAQLSAMVTQAQLSAMVIGDTRFKCSGSPDNK